MLSWLLLMLPRYEACVAKHDHMDACDVDSDAFPINPNQVIHIRVHPLLHMRPHVAYA